MTNEPSSRLQCPICGKELHARQEVEDTRWPSGVPRDYRYKRTRRYTIRACENLHFLAQEGGTIRSLDAMTEDLRN